MISAALSGMILAGVLSAFLFLGRSGANIQNYNDMEAQARKALEIFAEDTRQASSVTWNSDVSLTMIVDGASVTYTYSSTSSSFTRVVGSSKMTLLTGIIAPTSGNPFFRAYTITGTEITDFSSAAARTTANNTTKQVQISLRASRTTTTVSTATNTVLSARFVLRNKHVTA